MLPTQSVLILVQQLKTLRDTWLAQHQVQYLHRDYAELQACVQSYTRLAFGRAMPCISGPECSLHVSKLRMRTRLPASW